MTDMYGVIGTNTPDYLLAKAADGDRVAVSLKPGEGEITRGTVCYRTASGMYAPAAAAAAVITNDLVILDETIDTGNSVGDDAVAEDAAAYRAGHFIESKVHLKSEAALTDAVKVVLRAQGIVFDPVVGTGTFPNGMFTVTYKANNAANPAEDDVTVKELNGATHTALANSVTNFTAPATKSFSKWNTKADGTGTDVSAGGTVTITGDLTLYAVWA